MSIYPFNEGDDYWTIEPMHPAEYDLLISNGEKPSFYQVVYSCWDSESEAMHDENPEQLYFATEEEAYEFLNKQS